MCACGVSGCSLLKYPIARWVVAQLKEQRRKFDATNGKYHFETFHLSAPVASVVTPRSSIQWKWKRASERARSHTEISFEANHSFHDMANGMPHAHSNAQTIDPSTEWYFHLFILYCALFEIETFSVRSDKGLASSCLSRSKAKHNAGMIRFDSNIYIVFRQNWNMRWPLKENDFQSIDRSKIVHGTVFSLLDDLH